MYHTKLCKRCLVTKSTEEFYKCSKHSDGLQYQCKECDKNKLIERKNSKKELLNTTEKVCSLCGKSQPIDLYCKHSYSKDGLSPSCNNCKKEKRKTTKFKYRENRNAYVRKRFKERMSEDSLYRLTRSYRAIIQKAFLNYINSGNSKQQKSIEILNCDFKDLLKHFESQFLSWMSWDNYGNCETNEYNCSWHFDHIIPLSYAKTEEELYFLNHWSNFQPLCSRVNVVDKRCKFYPCTNLELMITFWEDHYEYINID